MPSPPTLNFRSANAGDRSFVYDLIKISLPDILGAPLPDWGYDDFLKSWQRGINTIITADEAFAGYLRWEADPDALHLADLQVAHRFRRLGVATQAMAYFEEHARQLGYGRVTLIVHDANAVAGPLYERLGYNCERRDATRRLMVKVIA